ncbi:MAG: metal-dependent transcriptional regulator [Saprospiraceae bacterium]
MEFTQTEENYLKAIFKLSEHEGKPVSTNSISGELNTSAASVTDMVQRLSSKEMIHYEKYKGVTLTKPGLKHAKALVRKHRLWEVFLVEKLQFTWDEVHDIAEQLEHIQSDELVERLDAFLTIQGLIRMEIRFQMQTEIYGFATCSIGRFENWGQRRSGRCPGTLPFFPPTSG